MTQEFTVAVIGAGTMGSGIAQKIAQEGIKCYLVDVSQEAVDRGMGIIKTMLDQGKERKVFTEAFVEATLGNLIPTTNYEDLKSVDFVIEAVFEDEKVKADVLSKLDQICDEKTILSSNTSSFYIKNLAKATNRPDRFIGMHYFFHPAKNRLLEIISHEGTSPETVAIANKFSDMHGKTAITVKDAPGFAVNRFFVPWLTEAVKLFEEGVANKATIDAAARAAFKIGMGPFALMNATGIPVAYHSANTLGREVSDSYYPSQLLKEQTESRQLWDLEDGPIDESKFQAIQDHLLATVISVAGKLVEEGVASIEDVNRGAVVGLRWKVGPFQLANQLGVKKAYEMVEKLAEKRPGFEVSNLLKKQAELDKDFDFSFVDYSVVKGIARIRINRPEAMNALNPTVVGQIEEAFNKAEADDAVRAIVFSGAGKAFVAGADLKFFVDAIKTNSLDKNYAFTSGGHKLLRRIELSKKYTIALLDGLSLGGGSELALACQAIIATEKGSMGFPESGLGIYPGLGGMLRTNHQIGKELTKYYVLTGRGISAKDAADLGIVTKLAEAGNLNEAIEEVVTAERPDKYRDRPLPEKYAEIKAAFSDANFANTVNGQASEGVSPEFAAKMAKTISYKGPGIVKLIPEMIDQQAELTLDEGIAYELSLLNETFAKEEALIGLEASLAGKRPDYSGLK
ncbi:3-hydroxyacyl-CoA dehydrogenase/enoyl-CoA hydratase family protein [Streptococcus parauberis]|uniref:3-hydroxyacyl-CoA dehydrogenase/enoyl-CoA hydratase family protein n=1 Tax=Streptococcus parauberis TaxID=1348 RepID=UPI000CCF12C9|nr:3-hydroxyacyl-CoA dehydrogenase/enoyl-CoA hydratase family protein [Streptococcus parauberis]PNY18680.1 putative 3-hydroxybutyryl-CoA dehydrogenase [Streptococcus parauberis]